MQNREPNQFEIYIPALENLLLQAVEHAKKSFPKLVDSDKANEREALNKTRNAALEASVIYRDNIFSAIYAKMKSLEIVWSSQVELKAAEVKNELFLDIVQSLFTIFTLSELRVNAACGERANSVYYFLLQNLQKLNIPATIKCLGITDLPTNGGHEIVIVHPMTSNILKLNDPTKWGDDCYICDAWQQKGNHCYSIKDAFNSDKNYLIVDLYKNPNRYRVEVMENINIPAIFNFQYITNEKFKLYLTILISRLLEAKNIADLNKLVQDSNIIFDNIQLFSNMKFSKLSAQTFFQGFLQPRLENGTEKIKEAYKDALAKLKP